MRTSWFGTFLATSLLVASCGHPGTEAGGEGGAKASGSGGTTATGGVTASGGAAGTVASGGSTGTAGVTSSGGATAPGGAAGGAAGAVASGGSTGTAGTPASGGAPGGASGGPGGAIATGGTSAGGTSGAAGGAAGAPPVVIMDQAGVPLGKPGQCTSTTRGYLNLGDMRIINNRWGSDARGCSGTTQQVCVNADSTVGWSFNRPNCGGDKAYPDYPEVEFGVAPFGTTSSNLTTPAFSSTTLLPIQLSGLNSATINMDSFSTSFQKPNYWNSNFEFWISKQDPTKNANAGVYAEIIIFLGWQSNRQSSNGGWPCMVSGTIPGTNYNLCHQSDSWSNGQWRFFNFIVSNGPLGSFSGKVDIKAILEWIKSKYSGFTNDMWLTRMEVGTEIDDNTQGSVNIKNLTFEVNGTSRSIQLAK